MKMIRDPVYGYISIDRSIVYNIIDTPCYQRLRNIRQTSYAPLYPSALHNRFSHSLGVYYLGKTAIDQIKYGKGVEVTLKKLSIDEKEWTAIYEDFLLACLLHDVGHAPFSHTSENFFLESTETIDDIETPALYLDFINIVDSDEFKKDVMDIHANGDFAKPHEIMSVYVSIVQYKEYIKNPELFARFITGYLYRNQKSEKTSFFNALIGLLNSSVIDVDKLDYIIRDASTTGYQSVSIDVNRLFMNLSIEKVGEDESNEEYKLVFYKSALSIIENVVFAYDAEKKWIQNHPAIIYDMFLIQCAIKGINKHYLNKGVHLFCYSALSYEGLVLPDNSKISLLADEDILYMIKNVLDRNVDLYNEYFKRQKRRHPIWKSEAEFAALCELEVTKQNLSTLDIELSNLEKRLINDLGYAVLTKKGFDYLIREEEKKTKDAIDSGNDKASENGTKAIHKLKGWSDFFESISVHMKVPFDFVLITNKKFKSNFNKEEFQKLLINMPSLPKKYYELREISSILNSVSNYENMFYIYYHYGEQGQKIDPFDFISKLNDHMTKSRRSK